MDRADRTRIGILLLPQFSHAQLSLIIEPLFIANWLLEARRFEWQLLAIEGDSVQATNGLSVAADPLPADAGGFDIVFVLASFELKIFAEDSRLKAWLRQAASDGITLCGVEGGTEAMAAAGLLDECRAAIHWDNLDGFEELYTEVESCLDLYVADDRHLSCAGGTAVLDLMFHWLRPRLSKTAFSQLQNHLMVSRARVGSERQGIDGIHSLDKAHPIVRRVLEMMRESIEEPERIDAIADRLGVSVRQLERHFRRELQTTPSKYYLHLRLSRAHRLLQQTGLSIAEVAAGAGFQSLEHFSRIYRRYYGCPPSQDRLQSILAPSVPRDR